MNKIRQTQASVNCIIQCKDEVLLLERSLEKEVDPGVINVLGGKVERIENYADAAIREAREETGDEDGTYITDQIEYTGTLIFRGGYSKDWIAQFYKFKVAHKNFPSAEEMREGRLFWHKITDVPNLDKIIWDLPFVWNEIIDDNKTFQLVAELNEKEKPVQLIKSVLDESGKLISREHVTEFD